MSDYFESGFSVREPMWHGLGIVLPDNPDWDEVPKLAGWPDEVIRTALYYADPENVEGEPPRVLVADGISLLLNGSTGEVICPAADSYGIVQPDVVVEILKALAGAGAVVETAGALRGYRQMWALARVGPEFYIPGDNSPYLPYVSVHNSFDGSLALTAARHAIRVVCANTQDMALFSAGKSGNIYKWKHSTNIMERIDEAKEIVMGTEKQVAEFVELASALARMPVTEEGVKQFLLQFIPAPPMALVTDRAFDNIMKARNEVMDIINGKTGTLEPALGRTSYGLFVAGNEYLDYYRPARSNGTMFGRAILTPDKGKEKLLNLAEAMARV